MILVTGSNGLLGSFVCHELVSRGYQVKALVRKDSNTDLLKTILDRIEVHQGDLNDAGSLVDAMVGVQYIIHAAALISFWPKMKELMFQTNVEGTRNLVDVALESNIKKFIHISSIAAIGRKPLDTIISEKNTWEDSFQNSNYAVTKHQAELEVFRAVEEGLNAVILNPSIILGPGTHGSSSVRLFNYVQQENKFYTDGYLNYVDVRDVVNSILFFMGDEFKSGGRYILNAGIITYEDFFKRIAKKINRKAPSICANAWMRQFAWRLYRVASFFTKKEPLITKETARVASHKIEYQSDKIKKTSGIQFRSLDDTIEWTSEKLFS
jgi:dihydroflavonol-4-reductase